MTLYQVSVCSYMPYKRDYVYKLKGSGESVVASKAIKKFRKELAIKGRRLNKLMIEIVRLVADKGEE